MNRKIAALMSLIVSLIALGLHLIFTSVSTQLTIDLLSDEIKAVHARNLESALDPLRNDLIAGNIREVRNRLYLIKQKGVFSEYEIINHGQPIDISPGYEVSSNDKSVIHVNVPIYFGSGSAEWGSVNFLVPNSIVTNLSSKIFNRLLLNSAFLAIGIFLLISMLFLIFFRLGHQLIFQVEAILIGREINPSRFIEMIWKPILDLFRGIKRQIETLEAEKSILIRKAAFAEVAAHVAHDIRSPLSALRSVLHSVRTLEPDHRQLAVQAIKRINSIADDLLKQTRDSSDHAQPSLNKMVTGNVDNLLTEIVAEKQAMKNSTAQIAFEVIKGVDSSLHLPIGESDLSRILSNLLNNSVESIESRGKILITSKMTDQSVEIHISDNGKGMSHATLARIGERGFSSGKGTDGSGSGLGVHSSKQIIEKIGGSIEYSSELRVGTTVILRFPR